jgi:hypothetical protein
VAAAVVGALVTVGMASIPLAAHADGTITSAESSSGSSWGSSTVGVSLPTGLTTGDLVVAEITTRGGSTTVTPPSGWAQAGPAPSYPGTIDTQLYYTVVSSGQAGQTSWNFSLSSSQAWAYTVREWNSSTGWNSSPLDASASAVSGNGSGSGQSTTVSTGNTGTTAQASELWVGALGWDSQGQSESGLTSGWTQGAFGSAGGTISDREAYEVATTTGTAHVQETLSAAEYSTGVVATFEAASPADTVTVSNPGTQSTTVNTAASLQVQGSDSLGKPLTFSATGLPGGLSISSSGDITGTPTTVENGDSVTVTATDGTASGQATFTWNVTAAQGGNCNSTGAPNNNVSSQSGGIYHLQANEFNSSAELDINSDCNTDFSVPNSQINVSTSGAPGGYPSLYKGCHWGYCTSSDPLPVTVASMAGDGVVTTSASTTLPSGQTENFDDSYDIWFNPNTSTTTNSTGLELMIWMNHAGTIQPAGSLVASNVSIGGTSYDVWDHNSGAGGTVTYVADSKVTSVTNLDLGPFATDLMNRGYLPTGWYLIDVEAGFEFWTGGTGAAYNSFSVCVNRSC